MQATWTRKFPELAQLERDVEARVAASGHVVKIPAGSVVFAPGQSPKGFVLLIEGDIRVSQVSETGREIVLYRVQPGEGCALTTACLLAGDNYTAEAIAETDITAVMVPRSAFDDLMAQSAAFRRFVLASFSNRLTELFKLVDEIAFQRLDVRLAQKLLELTGDNDDLSITHQLLAAELGTAREVVSRHMHELQRRGWIASTRGVVHIQDRQALRRLASEAGR